MAELLSNHDQTILLDSNLTRGTIVVQSTANAASAMVPAAAGARGIAGVLTEDASGNASQYTGRIRAGVGPVAMVRFLTGTAIVLGDPIKIADTAGRGTKAVVAYPGTNLRGLVGWARQAVGAGVASDTLFEVQLAPGVITE